MLSPSFPCEIRHAECTTLSSRLTHEGEDPMSQKHTPAPVPPANRPRSSPNATDATEPTIPVVEAPGLQEQDPKRRIGDFVGTGEHARQQPGPLNDATARRNRGGVPPNRKRGTRS